MHDCQKTSARLIDLVYDEGADAAATAGLRAEVESCPGCRAELRALAETLRAFDRAGAWQQPGADEWAGYQTRLAARLRREAREGDRPASRARLSAAGRTSSDAKPSAAPTTSLPTMRAARAAAWPRRAFTTWPRRALTTTWRVPAPAAVAAVALLLACLTLLALRPARVADAAAAAQSNTPVPVRIVEVPVVQEKIVTRTVYVARRAGSRPKREMRSSTGELANGVGVRAAGAERNSRPAADTLVGFRPAEDVKLRVIKGNHANEK